MQRYRFILLISIVLVLTASALFSVVPPLELGKWWKDSSIAGQLHLTESQVGQIEQCFLDHRIELATLISELKRHEADLGKLMRTEPIDEFAVRVQSDNVAAARMALEKENNSMMLAMRRVLTSEQWEQLEKARTSTAFLPGKDLTNPKPISMPKPEYTDEARKARIEGTVVLQAVVRKNGTVDTFRILQGLGHGLDESAIQTVSQQWRFMPGMKDGQPVDVMISIEVSFSLFKKGPGAVQH
jgi:TonB family protein